MTRALRIVLALIPVIVVGLGVVAGYGLAGIVIAFVARGELDRGALAGALAGVGVVLFGGIRAAWQERKRRRLQIALAKSIVESPEVQSMIKRTFERSIERSVARATFDTSQAVCSDPECTVCRRDRADAGDDGGRV